MDEQMVSEIREQMKRLGATELLNIAKLAEETGELAQAVFKRRARGNRVEEIADVILCALCDGAFLSPPLTWAELEDAMDEKLGKLAEVTAPHPYWSGS